MKEINLNETPVRTSRNFNINNITLEDVSIVEKFREFNTFKINNNNNGKAEISEETKPIKLKYGLNDKLTNEVIQYANVKQKINIENKVNKEIDLEFNLNKENSQLIENVEIVANEDTKSTIILKYEGDEDTKSYHNGIITVNAKKNSKLNIIIVNLINIYSNNFLSIQNDIEENAKVNYIIVDLGGKNSITNYYSNITGKNAMNNLNTIYLGKQNQVFDLNYIGELKSEKSNIDIEVQGVLKDNAKKHFKGTIDFKKGCKKAIGNENEYCMLLSNTAKSIALPMLLCTEEDVTGNHSTASGKVDEQELFYIMSRGISYKEAIKLIVRAKFNKIIQKIDNEELKQEILENVDRRLE